MSLIYDYLKINGKGAAGKRSKIAIPPVLLKDGNPSRFNKPSLLIFLGSCLIGGILIVSINEIHSSRQENQVLAGQEISPQNIETVQTPVPVPVPVNPLPAARIAMTHDGSLPPTVNFSLQQKAGADRAVLVFPEHRAKEVKEPIPVKDKSISQTQGTKIQAPVASEKNEATGLIAVKTPVKQAAFDKDKSLVTSRQIDDNIPARQPSLKVYDAVQTEDAIGPEKIEKYYQAGLQAQQEGDLRVAEIFYQKTLTFSDDHMNSLINLSAIYVQQERYKEAEGLLRKILSKDPVNSKALVNLGVVNLYQGKNKKAEEYFLKALQSNPFEENGLVNLAYLSEQKKDHAAAEGYYKRILQISPQNVEVLLAYAYLLEQESRYPEAEAVYQESLGLDAVKKDRELFARVRERRGQIANVVRDIQLANAARDIQQ